jgi:hypothetical protein
MVRKPGIPFLAQILTYFKQLNTRETKADTLKQLRPIGKGDQELEKRLDQKELT